MKKVLVTGSNGFVGSHICETLLESGYRVRALVRHTSNLANLKGLDLELFYGDLNDFDSLLKAVEGVAAVVNNGGLTKTIDPDMFYKVNSEGTDNILKAILQSNPGLERFIQISSSAACGPSNTKSPISEDHPPKPLTIYGKSKLEGERIAISYGEKIPVTILRPSAIYGPRDGEMLSFFKIIKWGIKPTFGVGECYINFTYAKDFARAVVKSIESDVASGGIYFVTEKRIYSYSEAGDIISGVLNRKGLDIHIPVKVLEFAGGLSEMIARKRGKAAIFTKDKAIEISQKYWLVTSDKIERDMGFIASTSFREGVERTVRWYKENKLL
ncbi:MAG: NAD-dependent epimerase/dehydratase family protein [Candidatus Zixiibacteriota bacterium]|nr:MAG: NAD-dependent epimerase/dehydratase family protein [candidate division Zixibacteria bacterium]